MGRIAKFILLSVSLAAFAAEVFSNDICKPSECLIILGCRCGVSGPQTPGGLTDARHIPQFVMLTFQGKITPSIHKQLTKIFSKSRKNFDGCPQRATFFIPGIDNDWKAVKKWYSRRFEIGAYSMNYTTNQEYWRTISRSQMSKEAIGIKKTLKKEAEIPEKEVRGWRTPLLEFGGDSMMDALQDSGFVYDTTLKTETMVWPFTMDYGWPFENCRRFTNACFKRSHKGFWEVPIVIQENVIDKTDTMATFSKMTFEKADDMFNVMKHNFKRYYDGTHEPFMMAFTTSYFLGDYGEARVRALVDFLDYLEKQDDVYVSTVNTVLEWAKHPQSNENMHLTCKDEDKEEQKRENFNHRQFSRYERYLYYYGCRKCGASALSVSLLTVLIIQLSAYLAAN